MDIEFIVKKLGLAPLAEEGGFFRETYRNGVISTAIYYLLRRGEESRIHRIRQDEVWHFYLGDPVELFLFREGSCERSVLGNDIAAGQLPQIIVSGGVWLGARLMEGGDFALMGTTVAPSFDYKEFEVGDRGLLLSLFPGHEKIIELLTKP